MISKNDDHLMNNKVILKRNLSIPSAIHGYSLGVEYMKWWFLKEFDKDFFKSIYIDGKYIFDDFRSLNRQKLIKREKPMLAIVPAVNPDYDRDKLDLYQGGREVLTRSHTGYNTGFLQDYEDNQFLGVQLKELEMVFVFKIRVSSRAQQLDLLDYMKMAFRLGSTQGRDLTMDFHVPQEIMLNIAKDKGFEIEYSKDDITLPKIKDIKGFLKYLNGNSHIPFLYKYRAINGNNEFFIKLKDLYIHISCLEPITIDDGEREGMNDNNYHLEMSVTLHFPVPHFYYYYTNETLDNRYKRRNDLAGLYNLDILNIEPPAVNEKNWRQYLSTDYIEENYYIDTIDLSELLENEDLIKVMKHSRECGISSALFMDIKMYNGQKEIGFDIDWNTFIVSIKRDLIDITTKITIYVDLEYVNEQLDLITNFYENRVEPTE